MRQPNEQTPVVRQMSLRLDSQEAINIDPGMSQLQIKELARLEKRRKGVRDWNAKNPRKREAHKRVAHALKWGVLVKAKACNRCGTETYLVGHHADYRKPLDVEWLCETCHVRHHKQQAKAKKTRAK